MAHRVSSSTGARGGGGAVDMGGAVTQSVSSGCCQTWITEDRISLLVRLKYKRDRHG